MSHRALQQAQDKHCRIVIYALIAGYHISLRLRSDRHN